MAVTFDAVGPSSAGSTSGAGVSSWSWSQTCGASANWLLAGVALDDSNDAGFTMSATYNGVSMTSLGVIHANANTVGYLQVWGLANPATGSALTVAITVTGGSVGQLSGGSMSFTGAAGLSAAQTASGASAAPSLSFSPTTSGGMVAAFAVGAQALTTSGSFTSRFSGGASTANAGGFCAGETLASTGSTMTPSWSMTSDWWGVLAVEVQGAAGSTSGPPFGPYGFPQRQVTVISNAGWRTAQHSRLAGRGSPCDGLPGRLYRPRK